MVENYLFSFHFPVMLFLLTVTLVQMTLVFPLFCDTTARAVRAYEYECQYTIALRLRVVKKQLIIY